MIEYFKLKHPMKINDLRMIHPNLLKVIAFSVGYCFEKKLPCVITSILRSKEENQALGSKSMTHVEGRAFDLSVKGWSTDDIDDFIFAINDEFESIGAISAIDGKSKPIKFHNNGNGDHFHLQVRR